MRLSRPHTLCSEGVQLDQQEQQLLEQSSEGAAAAHQEPPSRMLCVLSLLTPMLLGTETDAAVIVDVLDCTVGSNTTNQA